ncbi:MAG: sulfide/dihydroorotate dehydrogenase-like FAD/NAD-binding protein [Candidatus Omnitrophota bacterium]|nr:sulfide/dihydroorotate dehydrogenase-like FAD/NAD-binding protein [Candidatus Omnitrophota bacterium]
MKILNKKILSEVQGVRVTQLDVEARDIAAKALPGQFVVLMAEEKGERIPLTIVDNSNGAIRIIFQEVGLTTKLLGKLNIGDALFAIVGPLGHPTEIKKYGKVILVGGGVGIAEIYPVAAALNKAGNHVATILGTRTRELLMLEQELKNVSDEFYVVTDDGTYGEKGFTTDVLSRLLKKEKHDLVYAVGPIPMMRKVAETTRPHGVKTVVSLNALMVDGTGMCGCCRVSVAGETKFSCVDGPEFDAASVDWDELTKRNRVYADKEKHICNLNKI